MCVCVFNGDSAFVCRLQFAPGSFAYFPIIRWELCLELQKRSRLVQRSATRSCAAGVILYFSISVISATPGDRPAGGHVQSCPSVVPKKHRI